jgi:hypothetical protein
MIKLISTPLTVNLLPDLSTCGGTGHGACTCTVPPSAFNTYINLRGHILVLHNTIYFNILISVNLMK